MYLPTTMQGQDVTQGQFLSVVYQFSFSKIGCLTKAKEQFVLLFNYNWKENNWIHMFPKWISVTWNTNSLVEVGHVSPSSFPTKITITSRHIQLDLYFIIIDIIRGSFNR